jgi:hypothetical protein
MGTRLHTPLSPSLRGFRTNPLFPSTLDFPQSYVPLDAQLHFLRSLSLALKRSRRRLRRPSPQTHWNLAASHPREAAFLFFADISTLLAFVAFRYPLPSRGWRTLLVWPPRSAARQARHPDPVYNTQAMTFTTARLNRSVLPRLFRGQSISSTTFFHSFGFFSGTEN